jgi:U4/U6 small nuclear ribonucleoprotein PRP4
LEFSLPRSRARIERAKRKRSDPDEDEDAEMEQVLQTMASTSLDCSEIGDGRPLSSCSFSPDASLLATASWTGVAKLWSVPDVKHIGTLKGHHFERVTDVVFHPHSCKSLDAEAENIATASADRTAVLWSLSGKKLQSYEGHLDRLARIAFHPSGVYIGTASFDKT